MQVRGGKDGKGWTMDAVFRNLAMVALIGVAIAVVAVSMALHRPWRGAERLPVPVRQEVPR